MLRALLYICDSTINDQTVEKEQVDLVKSGSQNVNDDQEITGVLAYHQKKLFHVMEGSPTNITTLLDKIQSDDRNENINVLIDINHEKRIYTDWEFLQAQSVKQSQLLSKFLQENIDLLPMLEQDHHDILEEFVINIFG